MGLHLGWSSTPPSAHLIIPFMIPAYWTAEQAQAVLELLDDLRERIAVHCQLQLFNLYREQRSAGDIGLPDPNDDDQRSEHGSIVMSRRNSAQSLGDCK